MTPERANEVARLTHESTIGTPNADGYRHEMTPEEIDHVDREFAKMPDDHCWLTAFFAIRNGATTNAPTTTASAMEG